MSGFENLSREDKAKVIGGLALVGAGFLGCFLFLRFGFDRSQIDILWASGMSFFNIVKTIVPSLFLYICLPPCVAASVTSAFVRRRFSDLLMAIFLVSVIGAAFLLAYLLLSLFDLLFSGLELGMQAVFMMLAFMIPSMLFGFVMTRKKVNAYFRKAGL